MHGLHALEAVTLSLYFYCKMVENSQTKLVIDIAFLRHLNSFAATGDNNRLLQTA